MKPLIEYFSAARIELSKVTWPTRRQTVRLTVAVIIFALAFAVFLGALDKGFTLLVQYIISKG